MQTINTPAAVTVAAEQAAADATARVQAKRVRKPAATKAPAKAERVAKPAAKAKPDTAERDAKREAALSDRRQARIDAAAAVKAYYTGASLPFKAAADTFSPLRLDKQPKRPSQRQSALIASMLLAGDNVQANGTFTRGAFVIDGRNVQPETGALSDMLGRVVSYVSGPVTGNGQRDAVFKLDLQRARVEITETLGGSLARAALAKLDKLAPVKAKAVKA